MLFLLGTQPNLKTLQTLATPFAKVEIHNAEELKYAYGKFLMSIQPEVPIFNGNNTRYVSNSGIVDRLIKIFSMESLVDDTDYDVTGDVKKEYTEKILDWTRSCVTQLGELYQPFEWIFNLTIDTVFYASSKVAGGGTTSAALGVLWVDPVDYWNEKDMYEFLVHELGHTLLFLHEWRYGLYTSQTRLPDSDTFALSAIRGQKRPLDKALHSAVVATEILLLRENVLGHEGQHNLHPETNDLIPKVLASIESIKDIGQRKNMLTEYALFLLDKCNEKIISIAALA